MMLKQHETNMKVIIISPCDLPVPAVKGGAVAMLVESLVKVNEREEGFELSVVSIYDQAASKKSKDYDKTNFFFIRVPKIIRFFDKCLNIFKPNKQYFRKIHVIRHLKKILLKNDYDRVVFQNSGYLLNVLRSSDVSKKYSDKLFYHLHNDIPKNIYLDGVRKCKLLLVSEYLKNGIEDLCGSEMVKNCKVIYNGINTSNFTQELSSLEKTKLKKQLGISNNAKIIGFVGRIVSQKGIRELLAAFKNLNRNDAVLLIMGSYNFATETNSEFERQIKLISDSCPDKIKCTGYIQYAELWMYYKLCDLVVLPSIWNEPAGLTMIETCLAGVPLITTNAGGIPEYLSSTHAIMLNRDELLEQNIFSSICVILDNYEQYKANAGIDSRYIEENFSEEKFYKSFKKSIV